MLNMTRHFHSFFHRDWLPIFRGRVETPLSNCFNGVHIQTCVETLDDSGFIQKNRNARLPEFFHYLLQHFPPRPDD